MKNIMDLICRTSVRRSVGLALAVVMVFTTTYSLVLPALTITEDDATEDAGFYSSETVVSQEPESSSESSASSSDSVNESESGGDSETSQASEPVASESNEETAQSESPQESAQEPSEDTQVSQVQESEHSHHQDADTSDAEEIDDVEDASQAEGTEETDEAEDEDVPQFLSFEAQADDWVGGQREVMQVYVEADPGAFPKGTTMEVATVTDQKVIDTISQAVKGDVKTVHAVDITFHNRWGKEIEPAQGAQVRVTMSSNVVAAWSDPTVVHYTEEKGWFGRIKSTDVEIVKTKTQVEIQADVEDVAIDTGNAVAFETDAFSVYAIVGTETVTVPFVASDGHTYEVTVNFGKDAGIPEGSTLEVSEVTEDSDEYDYNDYVERTADAIDSEVDALEYIKLLDIKIVDENGNKVNLDAPVHVQIRLLDKEQAEESTQVVHFGDETQVLDSTVDGDAVSFSTDGFSIYAVVDEGNTGEYARMNLHFMNGETEVAMMIVKNGDTREELNTIIYDPGVGDVPEGTIFKGWSTESTYTVADADNGMDIDEVRDWAANLPITENEDKYVYAMLYKNYVVNYLDENGVGVGSHNVFMLSTDTSSSYTVNMGYIPKDDTHNFEGWNVYDGSSNIAEYTEGTLYKNDDVITISGNVTFSVNAPEGHWLVFDENGKGGTYNAPQFVESGAVTVEPTTEMTRYGYTFGGWYDTKEHADAHAADPSVTDGEFTFGNTISDKTTIYASWIPDATAPYTIIIWKQNVKGTDDDGEKIYDFAETISGTGTVGTNVSAVTSQGTGDSAYASINGTNKQWPGFHLESFDQNVKIVPEGTAVVNVYYDRTEYTLTFQIQDYTYTVSTNDNDNNPYKYGDVNGQKARVYWRNGAFRTSDSNRGTVYNGTVYTRSNQQSWQTIKEIKALYEQDISSNFPIIGTNGVTYNNGERWDPQSSTPYSEVLVFIDVMPAANVNFHLDTATRPLKTMNWYVEALPTDTDTVEAPNTLYEVTNNNVVSANGKRFVLYKSISARYNGVTPDEDFIDLDGFTKIGADSRWVNTQTSGGYTKFYIYDANNDGTVNFYYSRDSYKINYMDGVYVDGNNNPLDEAKTATWGTSEDILYQADISSYNKDGSDYYMPTKAGYVFEGWYLDDACTLPYTFTTMPKGGITVYAKWRQIQYRVFLHPNVDSSDTTLDWGSESQAMNFRISIGGTISVPTGRRTEYEFVGWYTDPSCTAQYLFNADTKLNEDTVTAAYNKKTDYTDPMDQWGVLGGNPFNSDLIGNNGSDRFWITKKLDLYGKWRAKLIGANGIGVQYDLNGGSGNISDNHLYLDQAEATAQAAATAPEGMWFVKWVVQTWDKDYENEDGSMGAYVDTDISVYPGDSFTVLKDNARYVVLDTDPDTGEVTNATYTVQLRAEYVDQGTGTPTHINWYGNNETASTAETGFMVTDTDVMINSAVDVKPGTTFTYEGHTFLGWARVPTTDSEENALKSKLSGNSLSLSELGVEDLFLKYDAATGKYTATSITTGAAAGSTVSKIAPDERQPYHAMVAVWEKNQYTVTVVKQMAEGSVDADKYLSYDFSATFGSDTQPFKLNAVTETVANGDGTQTEYNNSQGFENKEYGSTFTVAENAPGFTSSIMAKYKDDSGTEHALDANADGSYTVMGATTITFTNTRKMAKLNIVKTDGTAENAAPLDGAAFTLTTIAGPSYNLTTQNDGYGYAGTTKDLDVPLTQMCTLTETKAPDGYVMLDSTVHFKIEDSGIVFYDGPTADATPIEYAGVTASPLIDGTYTITVANTPGAALPHTGGIGTGVFVVSGLTLVLGAAAYIFLFRPSVRREERRER